MFIRFFSFYLLFLSLAIWLPGFSYGLAQETYLEKANQVYSLNGYWKFRSEDSPDFAMREYDDDTWQSLFVPGQWFTLGVKDVRVGWYRKQFSLSPQYRFQKLAVKVPAIKDSHEIYINGHLVGKAGEIDKKGTIERKSAKPGTYSIPDSVLDYEGVNVIAIRVGDDVGWGGIVSPGVSIGVADIVELEFKRFVIWNISVAILLFVMGLYFLFLFRWLEIEIGFFHYAVLAFVVGIMVFGAFALPYLIFDNFWFQHFIFHTGLNVALIPAYSLVYKVYDFPRDKIFYWVNKICRLLFIVLLLTPLHLTILKFYANVTLFIALAIDIIGFLYICFLLAKAISLKKPGAVLAGFGGIVVIISFISGILNNLFSLNIRRFGIEGAVVFMVCVSFSIFVVYSKIGKTDKSML